MFEKILVEKEILHNQYTQHILNKLNTSAPIIIDKLDNHWGKVKKPYLQKRTNLNLFIGKKRGTLVKEAPDAYGLDGAPHFYFIHSYNCIYECQYCFLQGYFNTPDLVLYVNHDEIINEISKTLQKHPNAWFHAGEFSDSLALNHITNEWSEYWQFFKLNPKAKLELRTKSVNIKNILTLEPLKNVLLTFSLSPQDPSKEFDLKTPSTKVKIKAMRKLSDSNFQLGVHFDPIIYSDDIEKNYNTLITELLDNVNLELINYFSLGVVRYTKDVYRQVKINYPTSKLHSHPYIKSFDNKIRYSKPMRNWLLSSVKEILLSKGVPESKIYLCME